MMGEFGKTYNIDLGAMPFTLTNCTRNQYRIIANLSEYVNISALQRAVDLVVPRFPMYTINMRKRWNSVREINVVYMKIKVSEYKNQLVPFDLYSGEPLFRVMYGEKFICLEMYHSLTDANGCVAFLNSILSQYFELFGQKVDKSNIISGNSVCTEREFEDSYFKYAEKAKATLSTTKSLTSKSFKNNYISLPKRRGVFVTYSFNASELKRVAKQYDATLHEYLVTILCVAFGRLKTDSDKKKCTRIQMPINLRKRYDSDSLRNFVATTQFDTFSSDKNIILQEVKSYMKIATSDKELKAFMWSAVTLMHGVLRFLPRFLGDFLLSTGDKVLGEKANSTSFSNLGLMDTRLDKNGVISYEFLGGIPLYVPFLVCAISFNNICNLTFSKNTEENLFEKYFLEELQKDGVKLIKTQIRK